MRRRSCSHGSSREINGNCMVVHVRLRCVSNRAGPFLRALIVALNNFRMLSMSWHEFENKEKRRYGGRINVGSRKMHFRYYSDFDSFLPTPNLSKDSSYQHRTHVLSIRRPSVVLWVTQFKVPVATSFRSILHAYCRRNTCEESLEHRQQYALCVSRICVDILEISGVWTQVVSIVSCRLLLHICIEHMCTSLGFPLCVLCCMLLNHLWGDIRSWATAPYLSAVSDCGTKNTAFFPEDMLVDIDR